MSEAIILEFKGVAPGKYHAVNKILGINTDTGQGDWPAGLLSHVAAAADGALVVFEVWDSRESQGAFMHSRLGPALDKVGIPDPARVEWMSLLGRHST